MTIEIDLKQLQTRKGGYRGDIVEKAKMIYGKRWTKKIVNDIARGKSNFQILLIIKKRLDNGNGSNQSTERAGSNGFAKDWAFKAQFPSQPKITNYKKLNVKKPNGNKSRRKKVSKFNNECFYTSRDWRTLRVRVLEKYKCKCMMCGRSPKLHSVVIHVDHIKPRSKFPELSLAFDNLQLLCEDCNLGKLNKFSTDHRPSENNNEQ